VRGLKPLRHIDHVQREAKPCRAFADFSLEHKVAPAFLLGPEVDEAQPEEVTPKINVRFGVGRWGFGRDGADTVTMMSGWRAER